MISEVIAGYLNKQENTKVKFKMFEAVPGNIID